ncbi:sigma-54 dependent transcriptional regulator [Halobacteriovorax sp. XZX-3]|uniref:sigma-54-dependent transcriptional regulator n=1 Tax=unclassified Halobacteriovorax TaxID=2639665 RepID=UPI00372133FA
MKNDFSFLTDTFSNDESDNEVKIDQGRKPVIIVVEDDQTLSAMITKYLSKKINLEVISFSSPAPAIEHITKNQVDRFCLITDISFEDNSSDGLYLIDLLKERGLTFSSIAMTGFASIETAIAATKKGVFHYLTKPFEFEALKDLVVRALVHKLEYRESLEINANSAVSSDKRSFSSRYKLEMPTEDDMFCGMIGRSKPMRKIFERIKKVAASNSTILIGGPSGTGKELVAKAIHLSSNRNHNKIVNVNCGAIPGELLESELFGHEKGAFTGAVSSRMGRFEAANGGSIFLDEIGDMPLLLQVKLLRVLQQREIERVGSSTTTPVDVRIITATHRNLEDSVQQGNFREDLYYRLNVIPIKIPALKDRREDIPLLISYFLSRFVSADGRNDIELDDETFEILMSYEWPGNVRELENLIERLVILRGGNKIRPQDLPPKILALTNRSMIDTDDLVSLPENGINLKDFMNEVEESLIKQALIKTNGNKNQASKLLQMNRTTLIEKMKKRNLDVNMQQ